MPFAWRALADKRASQLEFLSDAGAGFSAPAEVLGNSQKRECFLDRACVDSRQYFVFKA